MKKDTKPLGLIIISFFLIIKGILTSGVTISLLFNISPITNLIKNSSFLLTLFSYLILPKSLSNILLGFQCIISILAIIVGFSLLRHLVWALHTTRILIVLATCLLVVNPYYPGDLLLILTPLYTLFIFYLFHHKIKRLFYNIPDDIYLIDRNFMKSRLVILFSCLEIIIGLLLLRGSLWNTSLDGLIVYSNTKLPFIFTITIPKVELILFSIVIFLAGILTIYYRPMGRMINIVLSIMGLVAGCFSVFLLKQPEIFMNKFLFLITTMFILIYSFIYYFLLTNPIVKEQFKQDSEINFAPRIMGLLYFGVFYFSLLLALRITSIYAPQIFDNSFLQQVEHTENLWKGFDKKISIKNLL